MSVAVCVSGEGSTLRALVRAGRHGRPAGPERCLGAVCASDAFFPFPDGLLVCARAGVTAFVRPGGSVRDAEVIAAADAAGASMLITGVRHFRH